jgi:hypothetical protein
VDTVVRGTAVAASLATSTDGAMGSLNQLWLRGPWTALTQGCFL